MRLCILLCFCGSPALHSDFTYCGVFLIETFGRGSILEEIPLCMEDTL